MVQPVGNKKALISKKFSTAHATAISFPIWEIFILIFARKFSKMYNFELNKQCIVMFLKRFGVSLENELLESLDSFVKDI